MNGPDGGSALALDAAVARFSSAVAGGVPPLAAGEDLFDVVAPALSRREDSAGPTNLAVRSAIDALLACGEAVFAADRDATRVLHQLLQWARHFARSLPGDPILDARLEGLDRDWHWRTLG